MKSNNFQLPKFFKLPTYKKNCQPTEHFQISQSYELSDFTKPKPTNFPDFTNLPTQNLKNLQTTNFFLKSRGDRRHPLDSQLSQPWKKPMVIIPHSNKESGLCLVHRFISECHSEPNIPEFYLILIHTS